MDIIYPAVIIVIRFLCHIISLPMAWPSHKIPTLLLGQDTVKGKFRQEKNLGKWQAK